MGVVDFKSAVRTQAVESAVQIHQKRSFGLFEDQKNQDFEAWNSLRLATVSALEGLSEISSESAWKEVAFAFATCFARTPYALGAQLDAIELRDSFTDKLDQSPYKQSITAYLMRIIPEFQESRNPDHAFALDA